MDETIPSSQALAPEPVAAAAVPDFVPAGFWIRAGAYMIDGMLVTAVQALGLTALTLAGVPLNPARILCAVLGIGYFVWMPAACRGQTVGKMAAGIAVMRMDASPLTPLRCFARWAAYLLSGVVAGMGFIAAAFADKKRGLHDYLTDTRVIYVREVGSLRKAVIIFAAFVPPVLALLAGFSMTSEKMAQDASEESVRSRVVAMRAALAGFAAEHQGQYPIDLAALTPKPLDSIPLLKLKDHPDAAGVQLYDGSACAGKEIDRNKLQDTGKWGYVADPKASCYGVLFVDCTHVDSQEKSWASY
jgi:uncharacterized RDD family membrane protein YckC